MWIVPSRLNAIVDVDAADRAGWPPLDLAQAYLDGGARFLQLRAKTMAAGPMLDLACRIADRAHASGATVIVNDRTDIARLSSADGVHVGQEDLAPPDVRSILGDDAVVGLSTHTAEQMDAALAAGVSYVAIGPVFGTATKATGHEAVGVDGVRAAAARTRSAALPLVAIGGITLERAASVIEAGAASVAVISDLLATGDPVTRTREFLQRLGRV